MRRTSTYLWISAGAFVFAVASCALLQPADILGHYGLSFYGNFSRTLVPYAAGLLVAAYFLFRAARELAALPDARSFSAGLQGVALAVFGIVITPSFSHVWVVQDLHVLFGLAIFITQAGLSAYYLFRVRPGLTDWMLLTLQFVAIVVAVLSFRTVHVLGLMLPAQVLAIGSFGVLLIRAVNRQIERSNSTVAAESM